MWATSGRAVDGAGDDTAARWIDRAPASALPGALWSAVDGCGHGATTLTCDDAPSSTIHSHPYFHDLDVNLAVGECSPRRESEHRR